MEDVLAIGTETFEISQELGELEESEVIFSLRAVSTTLMEDCESAESLAESSRQYADREVDRSGGLPVVVGSLFKITESHMIP